jgi:hypothetical protein
VRCSRAFSSEIALGFRRRTLEIVVSWEKEYDTWYDTEKTDHLMSLVALCELMSFLMQFIRSFLVVLV